MNNTYMIFYRESDMAYFLFNGEWPIAIRPHTEPWGKHTAGDDVTQQVLDTERDVPVLKQILNNSRKKVFSLNGNRYVVTSRGEFLNE